MRALGKRFTVKGWASILFTAVFVATATPAYAAEVVTFSANGGSGVVPSSLSLVAGSTALDSGNGLSRYGYYLTGWSDSAAGTAVYKPTTIHTSSSFPSNSTSYPDTTAGVVFLSPLAVTDINISASQFFVSGHRAIARYDTDITVSGVRRFWIETQVGTYKIAIRVKITKASTNFANDSIRVVINRDPDDAYPGRCSETSANNINWDSLSYSCAQIATSPTSGGYGLSAFKLAGNLAKPNFVSTGAGSKTLYAVWESTSGSATVKFGNNGGVGIMSDVSRSRNASSTLTPSTFTREGYVFAGWNTLANGNGEEIADQATYDFDANITLFAKWRPSSQTINYFANTADAGSAPSAQTTFTDTILSLAQNSGGLRKDGLIFGGWNTLANGQGTSYTVGERVTVPIGGLALFARWQQGVTYSANGATSGLVPDAVVAAANTVVIASANSGGLLRQGYTFSGWSEAAVNPVTIIQASTNFTVPAGGSTLFAVWIPASQTVSYATTASTSGSAPTSTNSDTGTIIQVEANSGNLARPGYTFAGWSESSDGSGSVIGVGEDFRTPPSGATLHPVWKAQNQTLTYLANNATSGTPPISVVGYTDQQVVISENAGNLYKTGKTFAGWNTEINGAGTTYSPGEVVTMPVGGLALYATWLVPTRAVVVDCLAPTSVYANAGDKLEVSFASTCVNGSNLTNSQSSNAGTLSGFLNFISGANLPSACTMPANLDSPATWSCQSNGLGTSKVIAQLAITSTGNPTQPNSVPIGVGSTLAQVTPNSGQASYPLLLAGFVTNQIVYDANGANSGSAPPTVQADGNVTISISANLGQLQKSGAEFSGWNTKPDGTGLTYPASSVNVMPFAQLKLFAKWEARLSSDSGTTKLPTLNRYRPVPPGSSPAVTGNQVLIDQVPTTSTTINSKDFGTQLVTSARVSAVVQTLSPLRALKANKSGFIQIAPGEGMTISGNGYQPDSLVEVYLISQLQILVAVKTDSLGAFSAKITLPKNTSLGYQTLQFGGNLASGEVATFNTGIYVAANPVLRVNFTPNSASVSKHEATKLTGKLSKVSIDEHTKIMVIAYAAGSRFSYRAKQIAFARALAIASMVHKLYPRAQITTATRIQSKNPATAFRAEIRID